MKNTVLCHIAGPSGSGKSTLLQRISSLFPSIIAKDLDDFDDEGSRLLGLDTLKKRDWSDENLTKLAELRQRLMDEFIESHAGKNIVFGGHYTEGGHILNIPTKNKFLLDVDAATSVMRAHERNNVEDVKQAIIEAQGEIDDRLKDGYKVKNADEIIEWVMANLIKLNELY